METRKYPFTLDEFKEIYSVRPRPTVEVLLRNSAGEIALIERGNESWNGFWHFPGVTVYMNESVRDAVGRCLREELGTADGITIGSVAGYLRYPNEPRVRGYGDSCGIVYTCVLDEHSSVSGTTPQNERLGWFDASRLPEKLIHEQRLFMDNVDNPIGYLRRIDEIESEPVGKFAKMHNRAPGLAINVVVAETGEMVMGGVKLYESLLDSAERLALERWGIKLNTTGVSEPREETYFVNDEKYSLIAPTLVGNLSE